MRTLDPVELIPALVRYSPLPSDSEVRLLSLFVGRLIPLQLWLLFRLACSLLF